MTGPNSHRFTFYIHRRRFVRPDWTPEPLPDGTERRWCIIATAGSETDPLYREAAEDALAENWDPELAPTPDRTWLVAEEID